MKLAIASNNAHKLTEIRAILGDTFGEILSMRDLGLQMEIVEDGDTFLANALIKARAVSERTGLPALADDSGLCVNALDGAPGVHSARYAGEPCNDANNNRLLLQRLHEREKTHPVDRRASFVSVVVLYYPDGNYLHAQGTCDGIILDEARGDNGFGYDPYFYSDELQMTFAQADGERKNSVSHRARALHALVEQLH